MEEQSAGQQPGRLFLALPIVARLRRVLEVKMTTKSIDPAELIVEREAAQLIHKKPATLAAWRTNKARRQHIPYLKVGAKVFYRRADISAWLAAQVREGV
jgi:hypothetical protein